MTGAESGLVAITKEIAREFLHSVVLIDDRVYLSPVPPDVIPPPAVPPDLVTPTRRGAVAEDAPLTIVATEALRIPVTEHPLDAKPLLDKFAEQGLVCAVLRLDRLEDVMRMVRPAQRADIVVLDWKMLETYGDTTVELIRHILTGDGGDRHRLRLIAIYTGESGLAQITERIQEELTSVLGGDYEQSNEPFEVTRGPVRIVVYAKDETRLPQEDPELFSRIATPEQLPDRLLADFARMTSGLVSNVALQALACLRANMHSILRRLRPDLDAAYLSHRALVSLPEEAEGHLAAVVASEVASILDENAVGRRANLEAIGAWLRDRIAAGADFGRAFELGSQDPIDALSTLLEEGVGSTSLPKQLAYLKGGRKYDALTARFCTPDVDGLRRDGEFAKLFSLRKRYAANPPHLTQGTILKGSAGDPSYWLCVQPACDAVRVLAARKFPLLPLSIVGDNTPFDIVLVEGATVLRLKASVQPFEQLMPEFTPDERSQSVKPVVRENGSMIFTALDGVEYQWEAELKPEFAQRLLQSLSSQQARVGVEESEWMRRWHERHDR